MSYGHTVLYPLPKFSYDRSQIPTVHCSIALIALFYFATFIVFATKSLTHFNITIKNILFTYVDSEKILAITSAIYSKMAGKLHLEIVYFWNTLVHVWPMALNESLVSGGLNNKYQKRVCNALIHMYVSFLCWLF